MLFDISKKSVFFRSTGKDNDGDYQVFATHQYQSKHDRASIELEYQYSNIYKIKIGGCYAFAGNGSDGDGDHKVYAKQGVYGERALWAK